MIIIDRIEDQFAVCEFDGKIIKNIPLSSLPPDINEGDILKLENDIYIKDLENTEKRKREIESLVEGLWE